MKWISKMQTVLMLWMVEKLMERPPYIKEEFVRTIA
jgi:hypothetical protein